MQVKVPYLNLKGPYIINLVFVGVTIASGHTPTTLKEVLCARSIYPASSWKKHRVSNGGVSSSKQMGLGSWALTHYSTVGEAK